MSEESLKGKKAVVAEIKDKFERAQSAVVIDYMGINVDEANNLRKHLRENNVDYVVYKNTLVKKAVEGTEFEEIAQVLSGPSAFAFGYEDATAPARELNKFMKQINKMSFKAGLVEGKYFDAAGIEAVAALPSREELIAKFLGSISSPIQKFAYLMKAVAEKLEEGGLPESAPAEEAPAEEAPAAAEEAPAAE
jgi:large subunit ribosomal protein L10